MWKIFFLRLRRMVASLWQNGCPGWLRQQIKNIFLKTFPNKFGEKSANLKSIPFLVWKWEPKMRTSWIGLKTPLLPKSFKQHISQNVNQYLVLEVESFKMWKERCLKNACISKVTFRIMTICCHYQGNGNTVTMFNGTPTTETSVKY